MTVTIEQRKKFKTNVILVILILFYIRDNIYAALKESP